MKQLHWESRSILDSFPIPVCDNIRINRCRLVKDELYCGKISSKRRYFYGVKVQLLTTRDGLPVEFCILPGSCADLQGLAKLALELPAAAQLFVDAGYNFYEWKDYLQDFESLKPIMLIRRLFNYWQLGLNRLFFIRFRETFGKS